MYGHHQHSGELRDPHPMFDDRERGGYGRGPHGHRHGKKKEDRAGFAPPHGRGAHAMHGKNRDGRGGPRGRDGREFGFGRGPERGGRPLEQGDLRWLVLDLIALQPRHGYEIIKAIEDMLNGHYTPSPGVIYPTLTYLEETGMIASEAQATKNLYSLTEEGRAALDANAEALQAIRARIEETRGRFGGPPAPEMMRAMDNLRAAIHVRLAKGALSPESLATVTAALDRAAGEIERS